MSTLLDDFSMEMTGKDVEKVENAASVIPLPVPRLRFSTPRAK